MNQADQTKADPITRRAVSARAVVLIVALLGVDCAFPASSIAERLHRVPAVALRSATPATPSVLTGAAAIATLALILMLLFGGQNLDSTPRVMVSRVHTNRGNPSIHAAARRKHAVSYRNGGLYGP